MSITEIFGYKPEDIIHEYEDFKKHFILGNLLCSGAQGSIYETSINYNRHHKFFFN